MRTANRGQWQGLLILVCLVVAGADAAGVDAAQKDAPATWPFRAGAATSNITPPLGQKIVGGWEPTPASYVHDELHARALVLDDGTTQLAFVICDNVGIPREVFDAARAMIEAETDIPGTHVLMASTHTHSATTARGETKVIESEEFSNYQSFLARRIADSVRIAIGNLQPAVIGWGQVDVPEEVFNRRWFTSDESLQHNPFGGIDKVRMNPPSGSPALLRPAGPIDPEVSFISVKSIDGQPIALLANYSLHYVGGVPNGHVSADYFAVFADRIADLLAAGEAQPGFVGIMTNGTSGNINNINFRERGERHPPYEKMQLVADRVANAVYQAHQGITFQDWVPLSAQWGELALATASRPRRC